VTKKVTAKKGKTDQQIEEILRKQEDLGKTLSTLTTLWENIKKIVDKKKEKEPVSNE